MPHHGAVYLTSGEDDDDAPKKVVMNNEIFEPPASSLAFHLGTQRKGGQCPAEGVLTKYHTEALEVDRPWQRRMEYRTRTRSMVRVPVTKIQSSTASLIHALATAGHGTRILASYQ